jgi:ACS family 4-hydroxyphenylacetate permease-like MFS transporter
MADPAAQVTLDEEKALAKVSRRILWFLFVLTVINYLDRTNIGFAQLTMGKDIGISASVFGLSVTIFSVVYALFEIPSNLALQRFGARIWLARIMITWGIASAGCAFAMGPASLLTLRGFVGAAEAGFIPGLVLYLTYWYPQYHRARAQSWFMIAQPVAIAAGSIVSGLLLGLNGVFGMAGWRWLFLIEGVPAVILGLVILVYLSDRPKGASWLTPREQELIDNAVQRDAEMRERSAPQASATMWGQILSRNMLIISVAYFTLIGNFGAAGYWLPQIVRGMSRPDQPYWLTGLIAAIPPLCTLIAMPIWSAYSDRRKERFWTSIIPMALAGGGWIMAALLDEPVLRLLGLVIAGVCSTPVWSLFFTMPSAVLPRTAHAAGIAFMNTIGMCGAATAPMIMGVLRDRTGGFSAPMTVIGVALIAGALLMLLVPRHLLVGDGSQPAPPLRKPAERAA